VRLDAHRAGAYLDPTTAWPELMFSLSSPQEERAGATFIESPSPRPHCHWVKRFAAG